MDDFDSTNHWLNKYHQFCFFFVSSFSLNWTFNEMKLRTNLFVSIKILEQLCVLWHSNLRIINLMWKYKWEKMIHSEHIVQFDLNFCYRNECITSGALQKYQSLHKTTHKKLVFILWRNGTQIEQFFNPFSIADKYEWFDHRR